MKKIIDVLRKLGVFRSGSVSGTYTSGENRPTELMMDDVYNAKKDLVTKDDFKKKDKKYGDNQPGESSSKKGKSVIFWIAVVIGVLLLLLMLLISGFSLWLVVSIILWGIFLYSIGETGAVTMVLWKSISLLIGLSILTFIFTGIAMPEDDDSKMNGSPKEAEMAESIEEEKDNSTAAKLLRELQRETEIDFSEIEKTEFDWKAARVQLKMINPRKFKAEDLTKKEIDNVKSFFTSNDWTHGGLGFEYVADAGGNEIGYAAPYESAYKGAMCVVDIKSDNTVKIECGFGPGGEDN